MGDERSRKPGQGSSSLASDDSPARSQSFAEKVWYEPNADYPPVSLRVPELLPHPYQ
jgi:hypothetical protein